MMLARVCVSRCLQQNHVRSVFLKSSLLAHNNNNRVVSLRAESVGKAAASSYSNFGHASTFRPWYFYLREIMFVIFSGYVIYSCTREDDWREAMDLGEIGLRRVVYAAEKKEEDGEDLKDGFNHEEFLARGYNQKRKRPSFRQRRIISYENRIRNFSNYDKIFRYFATLKTSSDYEQCPDRILMTPSDFVRAITPDLPQPEGLDLDKYIKFNPSHQKWNNLTEEDEKFPKNSLFKKFVEGGLLTYDDFVFLATTLTIPLEQLRYVFRMIDIAH